MDDKETTIQAASGDISKQDIPPKRQASTLQRLLEHGMSFSILAPAIGSFLALLVMIAVLVPQEGPAEGLGKAFSLSTYFLAAGYVIGIFPSLITGLLVYPLWRQFGGGWEVYILAALVNCALCGITGFLLLPMIRTPSGVLTIGLIGGISAAASVFMTRRLRR